MNTFHTQDKTLVTPRLWKVVSAALLITLLGVVLHAYVFDESVNIKELQKQYPLIDVARHFIPKKDFLPSLQPLREQLYDFVNSEKDKTISVYIEFLNTGANININPETRFWPASLAKIPIALAVMGTIEKGRWTREQTLPLEEEDRAWVPSTLTTSPVGTRFTIERLLEELLVRSDNAAYDILLRNIPGLELRAIREAIGLESLFDERGKVTSKEFSRTIRTLYVASYLNRENSEYLLELLNRAEFTSFLRSAIPETIPFPHKYGVLPVEHTYHDSGIVYLPNRPYLITVMVEVHGASNEDAEQEEAARIMHTISNMSLSFFQDTQDSL